MNTLLLDNTEWDLVLDTAGNIAMARPPYARAQDVASALRLFQGELYYNTLPGVPYLTEILGLLPPIPLIQAALVRAALTVPGVVTAQALIQGLNQRMMTGQVTFTDVDGVSGTVTFTPSNMRNRLNIDFVLNSSPLG